MRVALPASLVGLRSLSRRRSQAVLDALVAGHACIVHKVALNAPLFRQPIPSRPRHTQPKPAALQGTHKLVPSTRGFPPEYDVPVQHLLGATMTITTSTLNFVFRYYEFVLSASLGATRKTYSSLPGYRYSYVGARSSYRVSSSFFTSY